MNTPDSPIAPASPSPSRARPASVLLTVVGTLLALNLVVSLTGVGAGSGRGIEAAAFAQPPSEKSSQLEPPFNAAEQRKRMIEQLQTLSERMGRIEAKLDKGLSVRVTEMPAVVVQKNDSQ